MLGSCAKSCIGEKYFLALRKNQRFFSGLPEHQRNLSDRSLWVEFYKKRVGSRGVGRGRAKLTQNMMGVEK